MLGTSEAAMSDRGGEHSEGDSSAPARRSARTAKAAAAAGTAGKSLESRMRDQDEAGDDLRKESDSEGGHSADDSGDEEVVPQKRKARAQKKDPAAAKKAKTQIEEGGGRQNAGRPGNSRSARAKPTAKLDGDSIFQVVASSESSLEAAVADWLAAYSEDKVAATCELLNFLLQAAGYPGNSLDVSVLEDPDGNDISEILEALNLRIEKGEIKNEEVSLQEYPLISRKYAAKKSQPGEQNKFAKGLRQWWIRWIERMRHNILHAREEDDQENDAATQSYAWDVLKVYTLTLSSSPMRHLRHTATFAALAMCSGLCQAGRKAADEEASLQRQLQAEKSKTGKRHETLQSRQKELESMRKAIDVECAEIFNGVFVHRYRDVDALIRSDCIRELGAWIKTYPETFLDAQYLRYAGWMMSDRTPKTRLPSVVFLKDLLRDPQAATVFVPGLRQFLERFRPRLLDIAQRDTDRRCREEAAQVVVDAALLGALGEEDEIDDAILPMLFDENGIVRQAAAKHFVNLWKTSSEDLVAGAQDNLTASHGQLKALVQLVCKALLTIDGKTGGEVPFTEEHALQIPELGFWYMHEAASLAGDELDGAARMGFAIESLLDVDDWSKDALMNWKDILKYLLHDFSSPQRASGRKAQQQQAASPLALSADEEATMLSILRASIDENRRHDEKGDDDAETTRLELSRKLAEDVTRLLAKYQADPKCTAEVVSLVQRIDPDIWFGSRVLRTQEALVEELLRVLLRSTDSGILMQTAVALRHLLSSPSGARAAKDGKSRRKSAAADTPARDVIAGSVRRKIAEACEEILLSGLDANLDSLQDLATSDHWDLSSASSSLTTVQSCVKRLDALIGHINVADILSSSDIPAEKSLFSIALKTAEQSAQALQQAQNLLESAQLPTSAEPLARTLEHVALLCLEILLRDVLFEAWTAADAHHVRRDADEIDSATHGGAASAAEAPDEAAAAAAKKRIEDKLVPLAKLCSAFLGSQADVPLGIRATSVKILAASAALAQSDLATSRSLQSAFESVIGRALTEVPRVVDRCVAVTSGLLPALERSAGDDSDNDEEDRRTVAFPTPKLPGCIVRQVRYQMNLLVAQAVKMVRGRYLPEDAAPSMLKWLGVSEEYERAIMQPFAERKDGVSATDVSGGPGEIVMLQAFWDKVVGAVLGDWLVGEQARSLLQLTAQLNTARAQAETLDQIKEGLKRVLDDVVVGSLNEVMCGLVPAGGD
ncbi:hypothetical protein DFJ74DRAFT_436159 [Hyaloraphidium curvatum]|nr:hypothetical protein DFJ74DRAFT_436159 [Hyaloraphidium curvatum]